jgi:hypothetical protein
MTIQVLPETIKYQPILDYYNSHKEEGEPPLQRLDRAEGGFKIDIPEEEWKKDPILGFINENDKIRQLRWNREGCLISGGYKSFTAKQGMLLYEALVYCLPPGSVVLL